MEPEHVLDYAIQNDAGLDTARDAMYELLSDMREEEGYGRGRGRVEPLSSAQQISIPGLGEYREYQAFDRAYQEELLENNTPTVQANLGGGCNGTAWVGLSNGDEIEGVWKPTEGEAPVMLRDNIPMGTYYLREAAAYQLDKAVGFGLVPPTVIREFDNDYGSVQLFVGDADFDGRWNTSHEDRIRASVYDFLMLNTDRHCGNVMYSEKRPVLIDNGLCFPTDDRDFGNAFWQSPFYQEGVIPEGIMNQLQNADWDTVIGWMDDNGIETEAVDLFTQRVAYLLDTGKLPSPRDDIDLRNRKNHSWTRYPKRAVSSRPYEDPGQMKLFSSQE